MTAADLTNLRNAGVITDREHDALLLRLKGLTQRDISLALDISRAAVRDRLENGDRKIERHRRLTTRKDAA